jgi:RimJ/RimL family protein N-acetyltransferase
MIGRAGFGAYGPNRELGYTLRPDSWGQGLATELALALVRWHIQNPDPKGPPDLWAYAAAEHIASRRVLEKVGFDFVDDRDHHGTSCAFYVFAHGRDSDERTDFSPRISRGVTGASTVAEPKETWPGAGQRSCPGGRSVTR